jgi:hypothetical protein
MAPETFAAGLKEMLSMFHIDSFVIMFTVVSAVCLAGLAACSCLALLKTSSAAKMPKMNGFGITC